MTRPVTLFENVFRNNQHIGTKKVGVGKFHQWGIDFEELEISAGNYTVAIIELADGSVKKWEPELIRFEDNKEKKVL